MMTEENTDSSCLILMNPVILALAYLYSQVEQMGAAK